MNKIELIEQFNKVYQSGHGKKPLPEKIRYELGNLLIQADNIGLSIRELSQIIKVPRRTASDWKKYYIKNKIVVKKQVTKTAIKQTNKPINSEKKTLEQLVEISKTEPIKQAKYKDYRRTTIYINPSIFDKLNVLKSMTGTDISEITNNALELHIERLRAELNI
jgi:hypothetical protein